MANPHPFATVNHIRLTLGIPCVSRLPEDLVLVTAAAVAGRRDRGADHGWLILVEACDALCVELRIADRPAFLAHARLPEGPVGLQQPLVLGACDHIAPRRPVAEIT